VFTSFVAQYGMKVEISNDPQEKPTSAQLDSYTAKDSLQNFTYYLEHMSKEYITDIANIA